MKTTHQESRASVARLTSVLLFCLGAASLGACAVETNESQAPDEAPSPGAVDVVQPLKLAERARVPEKEPGFVSAEVGFGKLVVVHDGRLPPFASGDVLGGTQGGGYLVRVVRARALDATRVAIDTAPASLTEFITEGHFHVHYDAEAYAQELDRHVAAQSLLGEEGGERLASQAEALKIASGAPIRLLDLSRADLPASCGVSVDGTADLDVSAALSPVLDFEVEIGPRGRFNPVPELKRLRFVASGKLDVRATLRGSGTMRGNCSVDLLELAGGAPSVPLPALTFWVGPVPVIVTTEVVPKAQAEIGLSFTATDVAAEARTVSELQAGVEYEDDRWSTIWEPSCTATGTASIQAPGAITATGKVSAGAELRARLYGILGPNVGVQAYARARADAAAPYCTYDARIDGGVRAYAQAEAGVSAGPLHLTLARLDLVDLDLVHFDGPHTTGKLRDAPECDDAP
jgi:hypothetical protein